MKFPLKYLANIYYKVYYYYARSVLCKVSLKLPSQFEEKKGVFLYFDYEREFGGHTTKISNNNVFEILDLFDYYGFIATWFTVGKIFNHYPESINEILKRGHEIGSHTFSHIAPIKTDKISLKKDFEQYDQLTKDFVSLKGFHSPNGKWSLSMLDNILEYNFVYDVIGISKEEAPVVSQITFNNKNLIRLYSVGDDWSLYNKAIKKVEVFDHYLKLYEKISMGQIGGIGAHPWILYSNAELFEGYKLFLEYLKAQKNCMVSSAISLVSEISKVNRNK